MFHRISTSLDATGAALLLSIHDDEVGFDAARAGEDVFGLREMSVRRLLAEGLSNKDIAARLFLTEGTVRNYVSVIMARLHANDRTRAVVKAAQRRIVKLQ